MRRLRHAAPIACDPDAAGECGRTLVRAHGEFANLGTTDRQIGLRVEDGVSPTPVPTTVVDRSLSTMRPRLAISTALALPVGATLVLSARPLCLDAGGGVAEARDVASFVIVAAAPMPTSLGTLAVELDPAATVPRPSGASCSEPVAAALARLTLLPTTEATAWLDAMVFETIVDGDVWDPEVTSAPGGIYSPSQLRGGSWTGRGSDGVFTRCDSPPGGVSEGAHQVAMRGILPDGTVLVTDPQTVTLTCPAPTQDAGLDRGQRRNAGCDVALGGGNSMASVVVLACFGLLARRMRGDGRKGSRTHRRT